MPRLPYLLAIPSGGTTVPRELAPRFALSPEQLFFEIEAGAREIFSLGEGVQGRVEAEVARAVIDLDRDPKQRPPGFPDGVIKSQTSLGEAIWSESGFPTPEEMERLVDRHHRPFHEVVERSAGRGGVRLGIDCRVLMPLVARETDRAIFTLSNQGDSVGKGEEATCPADTLKSLENRLQEEFSETERSSSTPLVCLNGGVGGGYLLQRHGRSRTPWLQLAVNPRLFLSGDVTPGVVPEVDREVIASLRARLVRVLTRFAETLP